MEIEISELESEIDRQLEEQKTAKGRVKAEKSNLNQFIY